MRTADPNKEKKVEIEKKNITRGKMEKSMNCHTCMNLSQKQTLRQGGTYQKGRGGKKRPLISG